MHKSLGITSFADFVATAKTQKNGFEYVSSSVGSVGHLVGEYLSRNAHLRLVHVAYKGGGVAVLDLIGGHVKVGSLTYSTSQQHIVSGDLIPLAVSSEERLTDMPNVPTYKELGFPDLVTTTWYTLSGPPDLPDSIVTQLNQASVNAIATPTLQRLIKQEAIQTKAMSPSEVRLFIKTEIEKWTPVARALAPG